MDTLRARVAAGDADAVTETLRLLDRGELRVAEKVDGDWVVHAWVKEAILAWFRMRPMEVTELGPFRWHDKIPLKDEAPGVRVVPPGVIRYGAFCEPGVVVMPGYVNIGARVGARYGHQPNARRVGGEAFQRGVEADARFG